jgi:hypothetical protein
MVLHSALRTLSHPTDDNNNKKTDSDEYKEFVEREGRMQKAREQWKKQRNERERRKQEVKDARIVGKNRNSKSQASAGTATAAASKGPSRTTGPTATTRSGTTAKKKGSK